MQNLQIFSTKWELMEKEKYKMKKDCFHKTFENVRHCAASTILQSVAGTNCSWQKSRGLWKTRRQGETTVTHLDCIKLSSDYENRWDWWLRERIRSNWFMFPVYQTPRTTVTEFLPTKAGLWVTTYWLPTC